MVRGHSEGNGLQAVSVSGPCDGTMSSVMVAQSGPEYNNNLTLVNNNDASPEELALLAKLEEANRLIEADAKSLNSISNNSGHSRKSSDTSQISLTSGTSSSQDRNCGEDGEEDVWSVWGRVVNDWETTYKKKTAFVKELVRKGVPHPFRGIVWPLLCAAHDSPVKKQYADYIKATSACEKVIRRDIARTYPEHDFFKEKDGMGQESLFNVMKAYSLHDREVGYCQGSGFIVGLLLMQMPEEEAFAVFVKLMQDYRMRDMFKPTMAELGLCMYQLENLVQELIPDLHVHFQSQSFHTSMYASSWFLTLFTTALALPTACRIIDVFLLEGMEIIFKVAIALLTIGKEDLLCLDMEGMLKFFQKDLPPRADADPDGLMNLAFNVKFNPKKMKKLEKEYTVMKVKEQEEMVELRVCTKPTVVACVCDSDLPRREENPFSFKHFLNRESSSGGARPKVYPTKSPSSSRLIANPELTSGLPDFVQDHLVIEQCYLNQNQPSQPLSVDMNHLAEFGLEASSDNWNPSRSGELPFDLTATRHERPSEPPHLPLDLPEGLPFDLPSKPPGAEVGASTSLPDFLSDGPIHSGRRNESAQPPSEPSSPSVPPSHSHVQSLQMENERLRREQETLRRQLSDQIRRNESLEAELRVLRSRDHEDTASLENMVRQVEDNLTRAVKRAETAELKAAKLKQEVKLLTMELSDMRGARGPATDRTSDHRLAAELRTAVTSAEHSLRQMLSGVDTLRMIASTLENRHRFEEQPEFSESESRDDSGPAL